MATGFTGRQTVAYFSDTRSTLKWAIGGATHPVSRTKRECPILIAMLRSTGIDAIVSRTRVLLSTAGLSRSTARIRRCLRPVRDPLCNITAKPWVRKLIDRYHEKAALKDRIIPCCGFDSVPSDLEPC